MGFTLFTTLISVLFFPGLFNVAEAGNAHDLAGYAWSENVGWFSFNSCGDGWTTCGSVNYGVDLDSGTPRALSGHAWSEHIGWVTFNATDMANSTNCGVGLNPPCNASAVMNPATGLVSGWARACSVYAVGCSGTLRNNIQRGDWEGWVKLQGTNYGVLANGTKWTGYAWGGGGPSSGPAISGSENIGWIQFRGFTSGSNPNTFGVISKENGEGPRTISCGVNKQAAAVNEEVIWSVYVDESKTGAVTSYAWNLPTATYQSGFNATQQVTRVRYSNGNAPNPKPGWVTVTAGGRPYVIDCDAVDVPGVPGEPTDWYPSVLVGSWDLRQGNVGTTVSGTLEANQTVTINSSTRLSGDDLIGIPYTNHFEIDFCDSIPDGVGGGTCGSPVGDQTPVVTLPISDHASGVNNKPTSGEWTPTVAGDYKIRLCANRPITIIESNTGNNCGAWTSVIRIDASALNRDLSQGSIPTSVSGSREVNQAQTLNGSTSLVGDSLVGIPYTNRFEIDFCDATSDDSCAAAPSVNCSALAGGDACVLSDPISDHASGVNNKATSGAWTPTLEGDYKIRLCVDVPDSVTETDEGNNCGAWTSAIAIEALPPPPGEDPVLPGPLGVDCRPSPSVTQVDRPVTWLLTGSLTGGTPPLIYEWDFSNGGGSPLSASGVGLLQTTSTYTDAGTKIARVRATSQTDIDNYYEFTCTVVARVQTFTEF
jgi:hypothetical protein